jgi:hypothetical protein
MLRPLLPHATRGDAAFKIAASIEDSCLHGTSNEALNSWDIERHRSVGFHTRDTRSESSQSMKEMKIYAFALIDVPRRHLFGIPSVARRDCYTSDPKQVSDSSVSGKNLTKQAVLWRSPAWSWLCQYAYMEPGSTSAGRSAFNEQPGAEQCMLDLICAAIFCAALFNATQLLGQPLTTFADPRQESHDRMQTWASRTWPQTDLAWQLSWT